MALCFSMVGWSFQDLKCFQHTHRVFCWTDKIPIVMFLKLGAFCWNDRYWLLKLFVVRLWCFHFEAAVSRVKISSFTFQKLADVVSNTFFWNCFACAYIRSASQWPNFGIASVMQKHYYSRKADLIMYLITGRMAQQLARFCCCLLG